MMCSYLEVLWIDPAIFSFEYIYSICFLLLQEQEEYAQGFIQALEKLHKSNGQPWLVTTSSSGDPTSANGANLQSLLTSLIAVQSPLVMTSVANHFNIGSVATDLGTSPSQDVTASNANAAVVTSSSINFSHVDSSIIVNPAMHRNPNHDLLPWQQHEMPQTVPCVYSSPPNSPDDSRIEQKRARNRIAAQKCRIRKIERIVELSERVRELKAQNAGLAQTSNKLQSQLEDIKRQLLLHVTSGCQVMSSSGQV